MTIPLIQTIHLSQSFQLFIITVKSTLVDFAVFVGGVQYVLRRLAAFLVVLSCILVAFGFMFYYVFLATPFCVKDEEQGFAFPHCTISDSLLRVYTMMMGEVDDTVYQTTVSQALYILYAFLVIILLSNVLIAIVTDSYGIIKNERAAMVFWSNRLNFIAEVDAIATVRKQLLGEGYLCPRPWSDVDTTGDEVEGKSKSKKVFRDLWNTLTGLFKENPYEYMDVSPGSFDFWCYLLLRIVAIFIIPVWLILGLVTAGWLWPPQVRERLLCQTNVRISRADIAIKAKKEISKLRHELRNLKREVLHEKKVSVMSLMPCLIISIHVIPSLSELLTNCMLIGRFHSDFMWYLPGRKERNNQDEVRSRGAAVLRALRLDTNPRDYDNTARARKRKGSEVVHAVVGRCEPSTT